jgi:multidrug efflux pump subunit AcrB
VTIAIAKKKGTNGVTVANAILERVESLRGRLIPHDVNVSITRNYGQTAQQKVNDLIFKLFIATFFVFLLVWAAFRRLKPAFVVLFVVPVVLLFTILCAMMLGFTIDRVSLFALIFSIGILVDDAIVVVENIYRRWLEEGKTDVDTAVDAVREVGNPTILATLHGHRCAAADGRGVGHDGTLHAADSGARFGGDADLAVRRVRVHAVVSRSTACSAVHALPEDRRGTRAP